MMRRERGIALINALVIVAMLSATAVAIQGRAMRGVSLTQLENDTAQAALYLDGAGELARLVLEYDLRISTLDSLDEDWARPDFSVPVDRGRVALSLRDQQGLFNLNLLTDPDDPTGARATFLRLCDRTGIAPGTAAQIIARLERNGPLRLMSALDGTRGLDAPDRALLETVATLLPERPALNVNTAPPAVIAAHLPDLTPEALEALLALRRTAPFADGDAFAAAVRARLPANLRDTVNFRRFTAGSEWFALSALAELGTARLSRDTLLHRLAEGGDIRRDHSVNGWQ